MQEWLTAELRTLDLGDKRLNARQAMILDKLAARPKDSLPGATCSWAELPAAYRFCDNQRITPEKVLAPHRAATIERIRREAVVLIAQDTTELVLDRDPEKGFGKLTSQIGLLDHVQIAVTPLGQHLGVTRCLLAGLVALLPIGGFVLTVVYLERSIAESWLARQPFYFPGLGLIAST
ncbi:MAG: hypothetical protein EXS05_10040, partial [Planctomycetaceae bacterium]|nr:hypothetical protein [Planctomycetaceae bacterium]